MSNPNRRARSFSGLRSRNRKAELRPTRLHIECLESRSMLSISPGGILPPGDASQPPIGDFAASNTVLLSPLFGQIRSPTDSASSLDSGTNPTGDAELIHIQQTSTTINGVAGTLFSGVLATFTIDPSLTGQGREAYINWGDGNSDPASNAAFQQGSISGQHVYAQAGTYQITVTISTYDGPSLHPHDPGVMIPFVLMRTATSSAASVANIAAPAPNAAPIHITGTTINGNALSPIGGVLANFTTDPSLDGQSRQALINWGDGTEDRIYDGKLQQGVVSGQHVYAQPGTYQVTVTVLTLDGPSLHEHDPGVSVPGVLLETAASSVVSVVNMAAAVPLPIHDIDAPDLPFAIVNGVSQPSYQVTTPADSSNLIHIEGTTVTGAAGSLSRGVMATFSVDPSLPMSVAAKIDWGDGTVSGSTFFGGTVGGGTVDILNMDDTRTGIASGQHVYAQPGTYQITVSVSIVTFWWEPDYIRYSPAYLTHWGMPTPTVPLVMDYYLQERIEISSAVCVANIAAPPVDGGSDVAFSLTLPQSAATSSPQTGSPVIPTPLPTSATLDNSVTADNAVVGPDALAFAVQPESASSPALVDPAGQPLDTGDELTTSVDAAAVQLRLATL